MSFHHDLSLSRASAVIDPRRVLPYIAFDKLSHSKSKSKSKSKIKKGYHTTRKTQVVRYDRDQSTALSIHFGLSDIKEQIDDEKKAKGNGSSDKNKKEEKPQQKGLLPFFRYRKEEKPCDQLRNMGYSPDTRLASQIYFDKVEERKKRYLNKMQVLKRSVDFGASPKYLQVKVLEEEIKRQRERELLKREQKRDKKLFKSLLFRQYS